MDQAPSCLEERVAGVVFLAKGRMLPSSSCGRGITCTLTTSPIRLAAAAPASTAALTAATSPATKAVTRPLPILSQPTRSTLAALTIASLASTSATNPLVSIMPSASSDAEAMKALLLRLIAVESRRLLRNQPAAGSRLDQRDPARVRQVTAIRLVGVDVHLEFPVGMGPDQQPLEE